MVSSLAVGTAVERGHWCGWNQVARVSVMMPPAYHVTVINLWVFLTFVIPFPQLWNSNCNYYCHCEIVIYCEIVISYEAVKKINWSDFLKGLHEVRMINRDAGCCSRPTGGYRGSEILFITSQKEQYKVKHAGLEHRLPRGHYRPDLHLKAGRAPLLVPSLFLDHRMHCWGQRVAQHTWLLFQEDKEVG